MPPNPATPPTNDTYLMAVVTIILYVLFLTSRDVISSSSSEDDYIPDVDVLDAPVPVLTTAQMAVFFLHPNISQRDLGREARQRRRLWSYDRSDGGFFERQQSIWEKLLGEGLPDLVDKEYSEAYRMCRRHFNEFVVEHGQFIEPQPSLCGRGISSRKRCGIILNWLAHGDSQRSLAQK